uniref:Uncharacterized protein n=1 Tax=viral metagenome TaxID=1070528 RepID=A0A6M3IM12_9ZZZZ
MSKSRFACGILLALAFIAVMVSAAWSETSPVTSVWESHGGELRWWVGLVVAALSVSWYGRGLVADLASTQISIKASVDQVNATALQQNGRISANAAEICGLHESTTAFYRDPPYMPKADSLARFTVIRDDMAAMKAESTARFDRIDSRLTRQDDSLQKLLGIMNRVSFTQQTDTMPPR